MAGTRKPLVPVATISLGARLIDFLANNFRSPSPTEASGEPPQKPRSRPLRIGRPRPPGRLLSWAPRRRVGLRCPFCLTARKLSRSRHGHGRSSAIFQLISSRERNLFASRIPGGENERG